MVSITNDRAMQMVFEPEVSEGMGQAFDAAWAELQAQVGKVSDAHDAYLVRVRLARAVIELVRTGEGDPTAVRQKAVAYLIALRGRLGTWTGCEIAPAMLSWRSH
jgi:CTP:molybdopterin cytidylyltransferase MocA